MADSALDMLKRLLVPDPGRLITPAATCIEPAPSDPSDWLVQARAGLAARPDAVAAAMTHGSAERLDAAFEPTAGGLCALAAARLTAGDRPGAILALIGLARIAPADGLAGLAGLALLDERPHDARTLAAAATEADGAHPRAHLVLGCVARAAGAVKLAQQHLAATSRLARRQPAFRDDQRAAQQLLLLLHLG